MRVVVIGAGVVGAAVAYRLVQGGAKVHLVDRSRPGSGTSDRSFAWMNANEKLPKQYYELNLAGMREHRLLRDELGKASWLHGCGNLEWRQDGQLAAKVDRLRSWGYDAELVEPAEVQARQPGLRLPDDTTRCARFGDEAWIDAPMFVRELTAYAVRGGARAYFDAGVRDIARADGRVRAVNLGSSGGQDELPADVVVNAAGAQADAVAAMVGRPLPLAPTSGLLVRLSGVDDRLNTVVHTPGVNLRPDGPRRILVHHDTVDELLWAGRDPHELTTELEKRARAVLPALSGATIEHTAIGVRSMPSDGFPVLGPVHGVDGYYEAVMHSGVTLAPLVGRLLAERILTGKTDPLLAPYAPDRFERG